MGIVRVLVVDDSRFFRRRVTEMLESDGRIKVIGGAENGSEAIKIAGRLKPDVITMDIEMPVMDGITATKRILSSQDTPILIFSSLTTDGAQATLDALEAGAVDYLPKRFEDISQNKEEAKKQLIDRVISVTKPYGRAANHHSYISKSLLKPPFKPPLKKPAESFRKTYNRDTGSKVGIKRESLSVSQDKFSLERRPYKLVVIGTSTGGPVALQKVLSTLPKEFPCPILVVQHMPGAFTKAFAHRLDATCKIKVREAEDGDRVSPGLVLLAPGGRQMVLEKIGSKYIVRIKVSDQGQNYKPCINVTLDSVAKYEPGSTLTIIMTGMGADGCEGAKRLKNAGSTIWAQDEATSVVYGMPFAVTEAGIVDRVLSLDRIGVSLSSMGLG